MKFSFLELLDLCANVLDRIEREGLTEEQVAGIEIIAGEAKKVGQYSKREICVRIPCDA